MTALEPSPPDPDPSFAEEVGHPSRELAHLREILDGIHAVIWEADATTLRVRFVAGRSGAILGYSPGRWLTEADIWQRILHPEDRDATLDRFRTVARDGGEAVVEYRAIASDERVVWIRDRVGLVDPGNGSPGRIRGMMVDVTEGKRAEAALRRERERYRTLAENVRDIVSLQDTEGAFLYVSPASDALLGRKPSEVVGRTLEDLAHPEDRATVMRARQAVLSNRSEPAFPIRVRGADGRYVWCEVTSRVVGSGEAAPGELHLVTVLRDLSPRDVSDSGPPDSSAAGGTTVLLLEEDVPTQRLLQSVLERHGYRVLPAGDAGEAVEWFRKRRDDIGLLFSTLHPRGTTGPELVRALRLELPSLPVVFTTEGLEDRPPKEEMGGGRVRFVEKPFTAERVAERVRAALSEPAE